MIERESYNPKMDNTDPTQPEPTKEGELQKNDSPQKSEGWAEYLKTMGNPMLKQMQEQNRIRIELSKVNDEQEIARLREELRQMEEVGLKLAAHTLQDAKLATDIGWGAVNAQRARDIEKFKSISATLDSFNTRPEFKDKELHFIPGTKVSAPESENSSHYVADWEIVEARAGHYVIERRNEQGKYDDVICSEEELIKWGNSF